MEVAKAQVMKDLENLYLERDQVRMHADGATLLEIEYCRCYLRISVGKDL
jgi:hypothetical protein